jgi:hypothetical protein
MKPMNVSAWWLILGMALLSCCGCLSGGKLLSAKDNTNFLSLGEYRRFDAPNGPLVYRLVQTPEGKAINEWNSNSNSGSLVYWAWDDQAGSHFVCFAVALGRDLGAFEYVLRPDQEQIEVYYYDSYVVVESNGVRKPVPAVKPAPKCLLKRIKSQ